MNQVRHMTLEEWDKTVAPLLGAIEMRTLKISRDIDQISEWIKQIPVAPNFETKAMDALEQFLHNINACTVLVESSIELLKKKEKVT